MDNEELKPDLDPQLLKRFSKKKKTSSEKLEEVRHGHHHHHHNQEGQTSDIFDPISSLADPQDLHTGFVKNVIRHFNPDRAVLVIRRRADYNIIADDNTEIWMGQERRGNIDDIELYQTVKYQTNPEHNVTFLQIIAGISEGKVHKIINSATTDGVGETTLVVEDLKKKTLNTSL